MAGLEYLRKTRGHIRAQVTKKITYVNTNFSSLTQSQVKTYIASLNDLKSKLDALNGQVSSELWGLKVEESEFERELES